MEDFPETPRIGDTNMSHFLGMVWGSPRISFEPNSKVNDRVSRAQVAKFVYLSQAL